MTGIPRTRRLSHAGIGAAVLAGCVALALPGSARPATAGPNVRILQSSQQSILATGRLPVRVHSSGPATLILNPRSQSAAGGTVRIGKKRRMTFKRSRTKRVKLPLSGFGRTLLGTCSSRTLVVSVKPRTKAKAAAKRHSASLPLSLDSPSCGPAPGGSGGGGSGGGGDSGGAGGTGGSGGGGNGGGGNGNLIPDPQPYGGPAIDTSQSPQCDFLDPAVCLQPFPSDYFTKADPSSATGRRVNFNANSTPANMAGVHISTAELNRNDGFSPGNMIIAKVPGLESEQALANTGAPTIDHMERYSEPNQPIVVINADTGERQPIWAEIDYNPVDPGKGHDPNSSSDRADVNLIIRPAVNFREGGHYIVALRNLKDDAGNTIQPTNAFKVYRDNLTTSDSRIEERRPHLEDLFESLGEAGIQRSSLYLTWDFTVASRKNLSSRALAIRNDAFSQLGDTNLADNTVQGSSPQFSIDTSQTENGVNSNIARIVHGTVTVPCYMNTPGCSPEGSSFNYGLSTDPDRLPQQIGAGTPAANTASVTFECVIPHSALDAPGHSPARVSLYGHGLLGDQGEVEAGNVEAMANEHNIIFCATDWYGFATSNIGNILLILQDVSQFPLLGDETQQGLLNFLFVGRTAIHPDGLGTDPALEDAGGHSVINHDKLLYDGNSQGGILGGALTAVAPDFRRATLGVPGMNYSTLLERSVDFEPYAEGRFGSEVSGLICGNIPGPPSGLPAELITALTALRTQLLALCTLFPDDTPLGLYDNYPNELERPLIFSLMQMLWDRAEPNGYAQHITSDPLPNTPSHSVLLQASFGDHQVANVAAEVEARTIGARVYQPVLEPGRYWNPNGIFGLQSIPSFPYSGSALVYWDGGPLGSPGGTATPPNQDIPPRPTGGCGPGGTLGCGSDPHSYQRSDVKARAQKSDFLQGGVLNNYCTSTNRPDPPFTSLVPNTGVAIPCHSNGWLGP